MELRRGHPAWPPGVTEAILDALAKRSWTEFRSAAVTLKPFLWAFTLGSTLGAAALSLIAYRAAFLTISSHRNRLRRLQNTEM